MRDRSEYTDDPDEIITVAHCRGCEQLSFAADLREAGETPSTKLCCPRCGTVVRGDDYFDYADMRVVEYE
jgi:hypothetical protein